MIAQSSVCLQTCVLSLDPMLKTNKSGVMVCAVGVEGGTRWPTNLAYLVSSRLVKGSSLEKRKSDHVRHLRNDVRLFSGLHTGVNTHATPSQVHTLD